MTGVLQALLQATRPLPKKRGAIPNQSRCADAIGCLQAECRPNRRNQLRPNLIAHPDKTVEGFTVGIMKRNMDARYRAREDRAGFPGVVANGYHEVDCLVHHCINVLGVQAVGRKPGKAQRFDGFISHLGFWPGTSRQSTHLSGQIVIEKDLSHLRATGISGTQNQDSLGRAHDLRLEGSNVRLNRRRPLVVSTLAVLGRQALP